MSCRVWELGEPALVGDTPEPPRSRELRKGFGERAHSGPVVALACPADGQLVWSASGKGVLLWDAACGAFLGMLQRSAPRFASQPSQAEMSPLAGVDVVALKYKIDGQKASARWICCGAAQWRGQCGDCVAAIGRARASNRL